jgi:hypothetical protein
MVARREEGRPAPDSRNEGSPALKSKNHYMSVKFEMAPMVYVLMGPGEADL